MALLALWMAGLFAYQLPGPGWLSAGVAVLWLLAALWTALTVARGKGTKRWTGFYVASVALAGLWWLLLTPRQDRDWADDVAQRLHVASFDGRHVVLDNVRDFTWRTETDYDARWVRREYDLDQLRSADLVLSYWMGPAIAHTLVSFGFDDGRHLVFSLEIRKEQGESFSALGGFFRRFEMTLVASEETDILRTRTNARGEDVYLYRLHGLDRGQLKALFAAYLDEAKQLDAAPAFYNTATSNCTTIVFDLARHIAPGLPLDYRLLLSGYLAEYAQEVGALMPGVPYAELHAKGRITERALHMAAGENYSTVIRRGIPGTEQDPQQ
ncbi:DUF4105 domain-containing protein [Stenotrophomonas sp.]|uniref:Lnb N-terminal periplasmic domain-containing protein n=1 Tax=Stenotrophomonas sp. TaxID=69392 RepID=UPI0028A6264A|nr:DUF4105 domain-containing protein [Stenotrophomonas sp.]